jgi:hypothetical protein
MPPANPAEKLMNAPLTDLIVLLLKQFKRPFSHHNIRLTTEDMEAIAQAAAAKTTLPPKAQAVREALAALVEESVTLLKDRWGFTLAESLQADMNQVGGWQTTAEFLEIANEKSNAELRIAAGSSLLAGLGDLRHADKLMIVIDHDAGANDVDATFARRMLCHALSVDPQAGDWLPQVKKGL